jgi:hypothetical protein
MSLATLFVQLLPDSFPIAFLLLVVFVAGAATLMMVCVFMGAKQERRNRASCGAHSNRIQLHPDEPTAKQEGLQTLTSLRKP